MTLTRLPFEPTLVRSPIRIVQWWESRRMAYNVIVGVTGVATLVYVNGIELLFGNGLLIPRSGPGGAAQLIAIAAYHGLVFSVGLTLLPAVLVTLVNVAGRLFGP